METRWKHYGTLWNTMETLWKHYENTVETRWKHCGNTVETLWKHYQTRWKHGGNTVETLWTLWKFKWARPWTNNQCLLKKKFFQSVRTILLPELPDVQRETLYLDKVMLGQNQQMALWKRSTITVRETVVWLEMWAKNEVQSTNRPPLAGIYSGPWPSTLEAFTNWTHAGTSLGTVNCRYDIARPPCVDWS